MISRRRNKGRRPRRENPFNDQFFYFSPKKNSSNESQTDINWDNFMSNLDTSRQNKDKSIISDLNDLSDNGMAIPGRDGIVDYINDSGNNSLDLGKNILGERDFVNSIDTHVDDHIGIPNGNPFKGDHIWVLDEKGNVEKPKGILVNPEGRKNHGKDLSLWERERERFLKNNLAGKTKNPAVRLSSSLGFPDIRNNLKSGRKLSIIWNPCDCFPLNFFCIWDAIVELAWYIYLIFKYLEWYFWPISMIRAFLIAWVKMILSNCPPWLRWFLIQGFTNFINSLP